LLKDATRYTYDYVAFPGRNPASDLTIYLDFIEPAERKAEVCRALSHEPKQSGLITIPPKPFKAGGYKGLEYDYPVICHLHPRFVIINTGMKINTYLETASVDAIEQLFSESSPFRSRLLNVLKIYNAWVSAGDMDNRNDSFQAFLGEVPAPEPVPKDRTDLATIFDREAAGTKRKASDSSSRDSHSKSQLEGSNGREGDRDGGDTGGGGGHHGGNDGNSGGRKRGGRGGRGRGGRGRSGRGRSGGRRGGGGGGHGGGSKGASSSQAPATRTLKRALDADGEKERWVQGLQYLNYLREPWTQGTIRKWCVDTNPS
jgi:hypothetical protein